MASKYRNYKAEGQEHTKACWAACLVWWLRATGKGKFEQYVLMEEFADYWDDGNENLLSLNGILEIVKDKRWGMAHQLLPSVSSLNKATLGTFLNNGPVYIGYYDFRVGTKHVNVIYDMWGNDYNPQVAIMEPAAVRHEDATYSGRHVTRGLNFFKYSGDVLLASPQSKI